ncbi:hypothetical protein K435DRAFT_688579 [Dendrothele bispora CBS 962.96]|uniref:Zn(2)-C6 fungal-type domain-containing protein n=1 Tax=Dendrothele bispora (strain CBS 962.96) TaxID=1314807 RepID=A0A4S8L6A9_DENBC|nr:hypothetical protein K435DRAFT_688579 [Dendrothele bispora CBS 962.96]
MPDAEHPLPPATSTTVQRPKTLPRTQTTGTVRGRTSPTPGSSADQGTSDVRPQKRARKAINCEPCRNSKLKCDRNRPCSSCVLRGTSASCYQDSKDHVGPDSNLRGDDVHYVRIDPAAEFSRLRHSINLLEAHVFPNQRHPVASQHRRASEASNTVVPKKEPVDTDVNERPNGNPNVPGMLGTPNQGGLYAGPTSAALHLLSNESRGSEDDPESRQQSQERNEEFPVMPPEYDRDLLAMLPSVEVIDGLITYYFEYCNWIYRHVNQQAFTQNWERFKSGTSADRLILATACAIMSIATHYLPAQHRLLENFSETYEQLGQKFFEVSTQSLQRRQQETKTYNLELVELLLIRSHYMVLLKTDSEEIWHIVGELVTIATAMGLHRDPGKFRLHRDIAERRRWAFWHIVLLERWQAFMFGRPLFIASHHFDTQLPSYCDPAIDKTGRLYLPNIALFRLAFILGDVMDDAVSVRPVPYESVQANDRALTHWMDNLPVELDLDEYRVARNLASTNANQRRLGVQSVIIRTSYLHIRFTLHRPYASLAHQNPSPKGSSGSSDPSKYAESLEIAVNAADKLITMVGQARPDFQANSALSVPGHMNWAPWHCFSAAMFFSFQLVAHPEQPGAGLFRASIARAMSTLEQCRGAAVADKAYDILQALSPLCSPDFPQQTAEIRDKERARVLSVVRKLAFPYHDSHDPRRFVDSPSGRALGSSPANSSSVSPPLPVATSLPHYDSLQTHAMSSMRTSSPSRYQGPENSHNGHVPAPSQSPQAQMSPTAMPHSQSMGMPSPTSYHQTQQFVSQPTHMYPENMRYATQYHAVDEATMWGAAVGFAHGEWSQFVDGLRPSSSTVAHRHIQG